ncbi:lysophospholipid acyltransferase family protein [Arthrobacter sp. D2-10]
MTEPASSRATFAVLATILRPLMNAMMAKEWKGAENLPRDTGFIVCPNHVTEIDPIVIGHFLYNNKVLPHFLAKASLFRIPVVGAVLRTTLQVPVERTTAGANHSLEVAREAIEGGGGIIIYPEGTLTRDPDMWPMKGRTGAARLALQTGAPVVPIAHWGAQEVFPRYAKRLYLFPRKTSRVLVGKPVDLSDLQGGPVTRTTLEAATSRIMDALTALVADLRGETPPAERWDPAARNQKTTGRNFGSSTGEVQ